MEVIRVVLSNQYTVGHHDYDAVTTESKRDRAGCLLLINKLTGKLIKAYSPLAWLEVSKVSTMVDKGDPF